MSRILLGTMVFCAGVVAGVLIPACATTGFPYTAYGLDMKDQELLAAQGSGASDEPLSVCDATAVSSSPCIVFLESDYLRLKQDYENQEIALQNCQQQLKQFQ